MAEGGRPGSDREREKERCKDTLVPSHKAKKLMSRKDQPSERTRDKHKSIHE